MLKGVFPATSAPDPDWWNALWPDPDAVLKRLGIGSEAEVVDLCCGEGLFAIPLARMVRRVTAIDLDPAMLARARNRAAAEGLGNCGFVEGDAYDVGRLVPGQADWLLIANTFHGVPEKARLARAMAGVLKPGGRLCVINWHRRPREETIVRDLPRGPDTHLRMTPDEVAAAVAPAGLQPIGVLELAPYHYAALFERPRSAPRLFSGAKDYAAPSVFRPDNLLREARRQKGLSEQPVPEICVLDPDGDLLRQLRKRRAAREERNWACYHTDLYSFEHAGERFGVVACAVGAPFAVLVAEELFASGCRLVISITSAGQLQPGGRTPYFILINRALRDEGTSHHYLPSSLAVQADPALTRPIMEALSTTSLAVIEGATWTTDAPFRETEAAISQARQHGALAVEMEAAALYAFARARNRPVVCFAHVTNQMAQVEGDFEKGEADGTRALIELLSVTGHAWRTAVGSPPGARPLDPAKPGPHRAGR